MFGHRYYGKRYFGPRYWGPAVAAPVVTTRSSGDSSDPLFYDWWRKRAQDERDKLETVIEIVEESAPVLREETIEAVEAATSIDQIQSLNLLKYERDILRAAIAEYQRMVDEDEEEAAILLLMH
jgi:hypothetical protein